MTAFSSDYFYDNISKYRDIPSDWVDYTVPLPQRIAPAAKFYPHGIGWILSEYLRKSQQISIKILADKIEPNTYSGIYEPTVAMVILPNEANENCTIRYNTHCEKFDFLYFNKLTMENQIEYKYKMLATKVNHLKTSTKMSLEALSYYYNNSKIIKTQEHPLILTFYFVTDD